MADSTTPFTTDDLFRLIARSGLLDEKRQQELRQRFPVEKFTPAQVIAQLQVESLLTPFQAKQLSERRHRGFFLSEKYKILDVLGQGGMSRVLLCEHLLLQRLVAVKILNKSLDKFPGSAERFLREARAAASMDHPNIARVFDVERTGLGSSIVMEFVDGTNLHDLAVKREPLAIDRVAHFIAQAAKGLQQAHLAGLVHRDIKPANLMLDRTGTVKLLDLGLARFFDPTRSDNLTQQIDASCVIGTADYIAPEQVMESTTADIRSDIYSLGYTMYFLLTRTLPAGAGSALRKLLWHQTREPEPVCSRRSDVPAELAEVLGRMIRKNPDERYQTPADVIAALHPWTRVAIGVPPANEMPRIMATSYRLGLCPPPDSSIFSNASSKVPAEQVKQANGDKTSAPAPQATTASLATQSQKDSSSTIGYTNPNGPDSLLTTSSTIRSAKTNPVMSTAAETDSTSVSSYIRGLAGSHQIHRGFTRRHALSLLGAGLVAGLGGWLAQSMFGRRSNSNRVNSTASAPHSQVPAADANSDPDIEQTSYSAASRGIVLRGGGSAFIRPVLERWAVNYEKLTGVKIEYSAVGSSKGIDGLISNFLDFACTDVFLSDEQLAEAGAEILHIPLALGAIVPTYNLTSAAGEAMALRFTGATLANIFLGRVKKWNDVSIALSNPGRTLPDLEITIVHRNDASGATAIWTDFLSQSNSTWKSQVGSGDKVHWPVGIGTEKNDGVADTVSRTAGAIGYVELTYALANGLMVGQVKNSSGEYVEPSAEAQSSALASLTEIPTDLRFSLVGASGTDTYPVVGTCWAVLRKDAAGERAAAMIRFLKWAATEGQAQLASLHFGRLPGKLSDRITQLLDQVTTAK